MARLRTTDLWPRVLVQAVPAVELHRPLRLSPELLHWRLIEVLGMTTGVDLHPLAGSAARRPGGRGTNNAHTDNNLNMKRMQTSEGGKG